MTARHRGDAGQAFPLYLTAVAGLLFLALAFFAVGRAGATRNDGQTAADAAALAAAQNYRDQLRGALLTAVAEGGDWEDLLDGRGLAIGDACEDAAWFAGRNDADLAGAGCEPGYLPTSFTVTVTTRHTVGRSVIPGTERRHARATAKAVVEPRCVHDPADPLPDPDPSPSPSHDGHGHGQKDKKDKDKKEKDSKPPLGLDCDGHTLAIDPAHPDLFPEANELFSVRLAE